MTGTLRPFVTVPIMRNLGRLVAIAALIAACNNTPSSPPSNAPSGTSGPVPSAAGPGASSGPAATDAAPAPIPSTSVAKIDAALASGAIDEPTSLLYRLYASVGDDRLPAEYQGDWAEDAGAAHRVREIWNTLAAGQQAALLPFMVRPTSAKSIWAPPASASTGGAELASVRLAATACQDGFLRKQVSASVPIVVWGQCGGMSDANVEALVDEAAQDLAELWGPVTGYMGEPIGDANVTGDTFVDSPEGGDGMLDIYLVDASRALHGRNLSSPVLGQTADWTPYVGSRGSERSSSYIVINITSVSGLKLRSTLEHEFFHALEYAHNNNGMWNGSQWFWFVEASAKWSEHEFVPEDAAESVYPWWELLFRKTTASLSVTNGQNEYASFMWPLFMEQELGRSAIAGAWTRMEGTSGFGNLTSKLNAMLSFNDRFRDFAVRVWNQDLEPGDPLAPRFQALDNTFPTSQPAAPRAEPNYALASGKSLSFSDWQAPLTSRYVTVEPDCPTGSASFDFTGLAVGGFDADLLIDANGSWTHQQASADDVTKVANAREVIVVISNHTSDPAMGAAIARWSVSADQATCNTKGQYSVTLTGDGPGAGTYSGVADIYCTQTKGDTSFYWVALMARPTAPAGSVSLFNLDQDVGGFDSVTVTVGGMENGQWFARSDGPQQEAHVSGTGVPGTDARIVADGSFTDMAGKKFTIHVTAECSETYYPEP